MIYVEPEKLITNRFDIRVKFLYVRALEIGEDVEKWKTIYREHLKVWNSFTEYLPRKSGFEQFDTEFKQIIQAVKTKTFDFERSPVPINKNYYALNGAHRIAASLYYNVFVGCIFSDFSFPIFNDDYFRKLKLDEEMIQTVNSTFEAYL